MRTKELKLHVVLALLLVTVITACGGGGGGGGNDGDNGGTVTLSGSLDQTFGSYGKVTTAIGTGNDYGRGMAIQADGKILVSGYSYTASSNDFAVVRYNSDGSIDTSFGTNGKVVTAIGTGSDVAYGIALQTDGKIVLVGTTHNGVNRDFAVVRYNTDGSLDSSFGTNGKVTTGIASTISSVGDDIANAVAIQGDGKIIAAGVAHMGSTDNFAMVRYNTNGTLDTSFGNSGKVTTVLGTGGDEAFAIALQADGKIVLAGSSFDGSRNSFAVVRYNTNGSLDLSFNGTGKVITAIGSADVAYSMAIQEDGKIVLAGRSMMGTYSNASLVRYNTDGSLDPSFGTSGKVTTDITTSYELGAGDDSAEAVTIQADGKIVAAGYYTNGTKKNFAMARYKTDGTLDTTFSTSGVVIQAMGNTNDIAKAVQIDSSGKIVVAGYSSNGTDNDFALARFNP